MLLDACQGDPLEKEMATHFCILAWEIPWTEEPGRLQSHEVTRVRHDLANKPPQAQLLQKALEIFFKLFPK